MPNLNTDSILLALVAITAFALLFQAIVLLALFFTVRKAAHSFNEQVENFRSAVSPVIYNSRDLLTRLGPKIEATVDTSRELLARIGPKAEATVSDLAEIAQGLREQTAELQATAEDVMERVRRQSGRVDAMCTGILDAVDRAGGFVVDTVSRPLRQISGIIASVKAMVEVLRAPAPASRQTHSSKDNDMFV